MHLKKIIFFIIIMFSGYLLGYFSFNYSDRIILYKSDKSVIENIIKIVEKQNDPKSIRESLIVRLANKSNITMYGRQINDTLTDRSLPGRRKYDIHPYGKAGVSASALVTYTDKKTKDIYILLGRKYKNHSNHSQGLANGLVIFAGYMHPHPLEGTILGIENISDEEKDIAEEAILRGENGYEKIIKSHKNDNKNLMEKTFDINIEATAIRELYEESGLSWSSSKPSKLLGVRSTYGKTGKRLHTITVDYLFDFGVCDYPPVAKAGSDIAEVLWIKLKDIQKDFSGDLETYSVQIAGEKLPIIDGFAEIIYDHANSIGVKLRKTS